MYSEVLGVTANCLDRRITEHFSVIQKALKSYTRILLGFNTEVIGLVKSDYELNRNS